jgi:hypothetical protein
MARTVVVLGSGVILLLSAAAIFGNIIGGLMISAILLYTWSFIARTILFTYGETDGVTYEQYQENLRRQGIDPVPTNMRETSRILGSGEGLWEPTASDVRSDTRQAEEEDWIFYHFIDPK